MRIEKYQFESLDTHGGAMFASVSGTSEVFKELGDSSSTTAEQITIEVPEPATITLTEEELAQKIQEAEQAAFAQGKAEGQAEGKTQGIEEERIRHNAEAVRFADICQSLQQQLGDFQQQYQQSLQHMTSESTEIALHIAKKIAGRALNQQPVAEFEQAIQQCLQKLQHQPSVIIRIATAQKEALEEVILDLARQSGYDGEVSVEGRPDFQEGQCSAHWQFGHMAYDREQVWQRIEETVAKHTALLVVESDENTDTDEKEYQTMENEAPSPLEPDASSPITLQEETD